MIHGGDPDLVARPAGLREPDVLAGAHAKASLQVAGQRAGKRNRFSLNGFPLDEEDGHYSNMFFILSMMPLPSASSDSPPALANSSRSSFCFGVSLAGIATFTRMS